MKLVFVGIIATMFYVKTFAQTSINIIPQPNGVELKTGSFRFSSCMTLQMDASLKPTLQPLLNKLKMAANIDLSLQRECKSRQVIEATIDKSMIDEEGYLLIVEPTKIILKAGTSAGIFYGVQSVLQLLPAAIESDSVRHGIDWSIPCLVIRDQPRFAYRGVMLDVARHYMPISFLQKLIDLLAMQKMNRLHLHLTDSQGWRFESKKYPKLTQIGAYRKGTALTATYDYASRPDDSLNGGFYTQDQLRSLVKYAAARFITIVPEIEMPAHAMALLASYPELACLDSTGKPFPYPQQIQNELCTKDETFAFLDNVLEEVMDVFPGKMIHVAGDEASKATWRTCPYCQKRMKSEGLKDVEELQSYFIRRIEKFVNSKGRSIIGWDEILQGGLAPNANVMSWTGIDGGIKAAQLGHHVVMTPEDYCYLDHYQSDAPGEQPAFGGLTTLATVYGFDPVPASLTAEQAKFILGTQGNLWTEYIATPPMAEYMIFPRSLALAEIGWTQPVKKDAASFTRRVRQYLERLDAYQVNYSRHLYQINMQAAIGPERSVTAVISGVPKDQPVRYTLDGTIPTNQSPVYSAPIAIKGDATVIAAVIVNGMVSDQLKKTFRMHKAAGKPVSLLIPPDAKYSKGGASAWANGSLGNDEHFSDDEWLGWDGKGFTGMIDFGGDSSTSSLETRFFQKTLSWVWIPKKVTVQISSDGTSFTTVAEKDVPVSGHDGAIPFNVSWTPVSARYMRIIVDPLPAIPSGNTGAGDQPWLFIDEIIVN